MLLHTALTWLALSFTPPFAERPFSDLTLPEALERAAKEQKLVVVDFFTTWCPPCKQMDARTWPDSAVRAWIEKSAIAIKLDGDREPELARRYGVKAWPSVLFLKPDGVERDRLVGFVDPTSFVADAQAIANGQGVVELARTRLAGHETDVSLRREYARALMQRARFDEALAELLWCFDEGAGPVAGPQRLGAVLSDIAQLSERFPPAIQALEQRRNAAEAEILAGRGTFEIARDFAALNRGLRNPNRTVEVYQQLASDRALTEPVKRALSDDVIASWIELREYQRIVDDVGDADAALAADAQRIVDADKIKERTDERLKKSLLDTRANLRKAALKKGGTYYEALLGVGRTEDAARVADRVLRLEPSNVTYVALIDHALRAQAPDAARALAERAFASLTEGEQRLVRLAAKKIPAKQ